MRFKYPGVVKKLTNLLFLDTKNFFVMMLNCFVHRSVIATFSLLLAARWELVNVLTTNPAQRDVGNAQATSPVTLDL